MKQKNNSAQPLNSVNSQLFYKNIHPCIWIVVLVLVTFLLGYLIWINYSKQWSFDEQLQTVAPTTQNFNQNQINNIESISANLTLKDWKIEEVSLNNSGAKKLVLINKNNKDQKILIDDTNNLKKRIVQEFNINKILSDNGVIILIGSPNIGTEIYFELTYEYGGPIFAMDINSMKLRQTKNESTHLLFAPTGDKAIIAKSIEQKKIFDTVLSLICLNNDSEKQLITLTNDEVLNEYPSELDQNVHIKWISENKIEYNVYRISPNQKSNTFLQNIFLKTEILSIPKC